VIKVEPPGGEPSRLLTAPGHPDLVAPPYLANNVGKRSMIIDPGSRKRVLAAIAETAGDERVLAIIGKQAEQLRRNQR
jgi:hypothetical protein